MSISFEKYILLERQFDDQMGAAAVRSFDVYINQIEGGLDTVCALMEDFFMGKVQSKYYNASTYVKWSTMIATDINNAVGLSAFVEMVTLGFAISGSGYAFMTHPSKQDTTVLYQTSKIPPLLVMPPSISKDQLASIFGNKDPYMTVCAYSFIERAAGTYETPKNSAYQIPTSAGPINKDARINLYGLKWISHEVLARTLFDLHSVQKKKNTIKEILRTWKSGVMGDILQRRSTYVHEYTHMLDDIRYKVDAPSNITKANLKFYQNNDLKAYYTSDAEWNAHFQDDAILLRDALRKALIAMTNTYVAQKMVHEKETNVPLNVSDSSLPAVLPNKRQEFAMDMLKFIMKNMYHLMGYHAKYYAGMLEKTLANPPSTFTPAATDTLRRVLEIYKGHENQTIFKFLFILTSVVRIDSMEHLLSDDRFKKKLLSRMYSVVLDCENIFKEYKERLLQGKWPSPQERNVAMKPFTDKYKVVKHGSMSGLKVGGGESYYSEIAHPFMSGNRETTAVFVFNPNKPFKA